MRELNEYTVGLATKLANAGHRSLVTVTDSVKSVADCFPGVKRVAGGETRYWKGLYVFTCKPDIERVSMCAPVLRGVGHGKLIERERSPPG